MGLPDQLIRNIPRAVRVIQSGSKSGGGESLGDVVNQVRKLGRIVDPSYAPHLRRQGGRLPVSQPGPTRPYTPSPTSGPGSQPLPRLSNPTRPTPANPTPATGWTTKPTPVSQPGRIKSPKTNPNPTPQPGSNPNPNAGQPAPVGKPAGVSLPGIKPSEQPGSKPTGDTSGSGGNASQPTDYYFPPASPPVGGYLFVYVGIGGQANFDARSGEIVKPGPSVEGRVVFVTTGTVVGAKITNPSPFINSLPQDSVSLIGSRGASIGQVVAVTGYDQNIPFATFKSLKVKEVSYTPVEGEYQPTDPVPENGNTPAPVTNNAPNVLTAPGIQDSPTPTPSRNPGTTPNKQPVKTPNPGEKPTPENPNSPEPNSPSSPQPTPSGKGNTSSGSSTQEEYDIPESVKTKVTELEQKLTDLTNRVNEDKQKQQFSCKFERTELAEVNAKLDRILELLEKEDSDQEELDKYDAMPLPIAVKTGDRTGEVQTRTILVKKGQSDLAQQFAVSAGFGLLGIAGVWSRLTYELLGGGSIFNEQHQATVNAKQVVEEAGKAQTDDEGATFKAAPVVGVMGLVAAIGGAAWIRQGLHTLPRQVPNLALDPAQNLTTTATNAVDVTMTSTSQGNAIMTGLRGVNRFLKRANEQLKLDRIFNILTLVTTIHNAAMLSNSIKDTLVSAVDNAIATLGWLPKDEDGNQIQLSELVNDTIENTIVSIIGRENYDGITTTWKKANRIYQAAANILYSLQSMMSSVINALEVGFGWVAWIGNALKKWGVVTEKAYAWMNPSPNFQNPVFTALDKGQNIAENLETVTSEVRATGDTFNGLGELKTELDKSLEEGTAQPQIGNQQQGTLSNQSKTASAAPEIASTDLIKPESDE